MDRTAVFPVRQVKTKQEFRKAAQYGHDRAQLKYFAVRKMILKILKNLGINVSVNIRQRHLFAGAKHRAFFICKNIGIYVAGQSVNLTISYPMLPRRGSIYAISE